MFLTPLQTRNVKRTKILNGLQSDESSPHATGSVFSILRMVKAEIDPFYIVYLVLHTHTLYAPKDGYIPSWFLGAF